MGCVLLAAAQAPREAGSSPVPWPEGPLAVCIATVGAHYGSGTAYVFAFDGAAWRQQAKLTADASALPAGLYLVRLRAGDFAATRRVTLLR